MSVWRGDGHFRSFQKRQGSNRDFPLPTTTNERQFCWSSSCRDVTATVACSYFLPPAPTQFTACSAFRPLADPFSLPCECLLLPTVPIGIPKRSIPVPAAASTFYRPDALQESMRFSGLRELASQSRRQMRRARSLGRASQRRRLLCWVGWSQLASSVTGRQGRGRKTPTLQWYHHHRTLRRILATTFLPSHQGQIFQQEKGRLCGDRGDWN